MWQPRPITEDEVDLFRERLARGFGSDAATDEAARARFEELFELERSVAVFDQGELVGTAGAFSLDLTLPGESLAPMGGTTMATVQPTHRRRGVLTAMMTYHLDEVTERGESLAGLWASEAGIYGRFGYGIATERHLLSVDARTVELRGPPPPGRVRLANADQAEKPMREVYERVRPTIPGMLSRSDAWWRHRVMRDDREERGGRSSRRYALYEAEGGVEGYATYRQKEDWSDFVSSGQIKVGEVLASTDAAHSALWRYLCNIDLFPRVEYWNAAIDDPLPRKVEDPRRVERRRADSLWLRVLDVPAALEARHYEFDGALVIEVEDSFRQRTSGTYSLVVDGGVGRCATGGSPDVTMDVGVLGELMLGGGSAPALAAAGRVRGPEESIRTLHRVFGTDRAPWCQEVF